MKGHSFKNIECVKCNKIHIHPKGMLGKSNKGVHKGKPAWNKGLTKEIDSRIAKYGKTNSLRERSPEFIKKLTEQGRKSLKKYKKEHPEHQKYAGFCASLKRPINTVWNFISKPQKSLFNIVSEIYPDSIMNYRVVYLENNIKRVFYLDIAIPSLKTDVEYDSDYYHQNKEKDKRRDKILNNLGWKIIRINEKKFKQIEKEGLKCVLLS